MTLRIGAVARCLNTPHIRGMGKYVFELIQNSRERHGIEWILFGNDQRYGMAAPEVESLTTDTFEFRGDRFCLWEQMGLPLRAIKRNVDVLHCTEGTLPLWHPKPTVVTIHDTLSWEERPNTPGAKLYWDTLMPAALKKCAAIITISESSRVDILAKWPWLEKKMSVIPHGIEDAYFAEDRGRIPVELASTIGNSPYLVYMGGPMERKRFNWATEVLAHTQHPTLKLIACGFGTEARRIAEVKLPEHLKDRVHFASFLSDSELRALYRGAKAVLYPTLYEGFGFPAIEAQAAGVPAIFSALGSLKELIGPLAVVVPPHDMDAWVAAVDQALTMGERRVEMALAASMWVRQFEWKQSFAKHLAVYQQVGQKTV